MAHLRLLPDFEKSRQRYVNALKTFAAAHRELEQHEVTQVVSANARGAKAQ
jgi:hypothetical protein